MNESIVKIIDESKQLELESESSITKNFTRERGEGAVKEKKIEVVPNHSKLSEARRRRVNKATKTPL